MTIEKLEPFVGEWELEVSFAPAPPGAPPVTTRFEWALDNQFLVQRTEIPIPEAPDSLLLYAPNPETGGYTQHYFDSRGVVRIYEMTFDGKTWTLTREKPDFTPLDFSQRWTATLSDDGRTIEGKWEKNGPDYELDFELTYRRVG